MAKKLSVEEVLAACRADDGDGSAPAAPAASDAPADAPAEAAAPAAKKGASAMSVEEMMAAARGEKSGAADPAPKKDAKAMSVEEMMAAARGEKSAAAPAAPKKAAKPAGKAKPAAKAPVAEAKGPRDTASILAAARKASKPGPMSKAEAAAKKGTTGKKKLAAPPMPEKPAYAVATAAPAAADPDRRGFMSTCVNAFFGSSMAVGFTSLAVTHLLWVLGLARFMFPNILTEPPTQFKVGFPDEFGPGQVETKFKAQFGVWVVKHIYNGQSQIYALQSVCTHLGCTPNWLEGEQKFKCPCHGSGFYKDGVNFEGPAPRPLERFAIKVADDGQLEVDKSRTFLEELGQWEDPSSFVSV